MSIITRLGFKNVFRQPLRTTLALLGIAVSVAGVVVGMSFMGGIESMIFGEAVGEFGEIVVARQDYFDRSRFNPLKYSLKGSGPLTEGLLALPEVHAAVGRIDFGFLAEHEEQSTTLAASAVDVEQFARYSKLPERLVSGRFLVPGEKALVIGKWVAEELEVGPGDLLTVLGRTAYDSFTADDFEVVGVYDMGSKLANRGSVMPLAPAQEFLEMPDAVSRILIYTDDYRNVDRAVAEIDAAHLLDEGIALRTWKEDVFLGSGYQALQAGGFIISFIICFVAGLGILNMMMVTVLERRKEMGVLMALGMSRTNIVLSFLVEALAYGVLGGVAGILLGTPLALYLDRVGISVPADKIEGLPIAISNTLYADFGPESIGWGLALGILLSLLGALGPALKTSSMGPLDAMTR